ncbi:MAG: maleylpyruvate isomerase family mycothiol-dependent enzyme [Actinomycetota bacterium]|nr:maleylpyruvate isomerase family mycothiol-dependent enzyme [Actinomycetota bacterium]MDQ2957495.1 maleylpyruvate isomerase family mycothiol-dependent enzyme [Actinomycetota bacterium]
MYDQLYSDSHRRVADLVTALGPAELALNVPACPLWSVADVLAHLAGASAAQAEGSDPDAGEPGSEQWTQSQVQARRGRSTAEVLAEWDRHAPAVEQLPLTSRSWLPILHDTLSHEADIRGAIGAPQVPADALAAAYPLLVPMLTRQLAGLGIVLLDLDQQRIELGSGEPDVLVEASRYEFWRAVFGRRSLAQIRGWVRAGEAAAFAESLPVFVPRDTDLTEPG